MFTLPRGFTSGDALRWRRVGGLVLAEAEFAPDQRIAETHRQARFVLVLRGALVAPAAAATHPASTLLFLAPHEPHRFVAGPSGAVCLIVEMDRAWLAQARQRAPVLSATSSFRGGLVLHLAHRLYGEFRLRDEVSRLATESLVLGVLAEASRRAARPAPAAAPAWLVRARAFVDAHFSERLLLAAVAAMVGIHPVHLARTFRRVYGVTFAGHVRELRVDFAREQLVATRAPLGDIALAAGFCDQSHFCRQFKRATGLSPAEYRLAYRPG